MPRDNLVGFIETMIGSAGMRFLRCFPTHHRIERPNSLKIPARRDGILTDGERLLSISG
jgi:hypothetical protein